MIPSFLNVSLLVNSLYISGKLYTYMHPLTASVLLKVESKLISESGQKHYSPITIFYYYIKIYRFLF